MKLGRKGLMKPIVAKAHITILVVAWASCHQGTSRRVWESACEINKSILALLMLVFDGKNLNCLHLVSRSIVLAVNHPNSSP